MAPRPPVPRLRPSAVGLLLPLLLLLVAVGLPGGSGPRTEPPIPVRMLMPAPFAEATAAAVRSFNRDHPGLRVEVTSGPLDTEQISDLAISSLLLGDTPFDLLLVDVSWLAKYVAAGWLLPLERWFGPDTLAEMVPGARLGNELAGHLWRMPLNGDTGLLYWRTDLMAAPPRSTEELEAIARDLQRRGRVRWGYVWQGRQYEGLSCFALEVLEAFGARWWEADGTAAGRTRLAEPAALRAAGWLERLVRTGVTPPAVANFAENEALAVFAAGDAAFLRNWPYAWAELARSPRVAGKVGVGPVVAAPGHRTGGTLGTWGLSLLAGSPHPEEAAAVLRWFTGPALQRELALRYGYAPTWRSLYEDPELQRRQPLLAVQRQALEHPVLRPPTPLYAQLSDLLQRQLNGMLTGEAAAAGAMERAQAQSGLLARATAGSSPAPPVPASVSPSPRGAPGEGGPSGSPP